MPENSNCRLKRWIKMKEKRISNKTEQYQSRAYAQMCKSTLPVIAIVAGLFVVEVGAEKSCTTSLPPISGGHIDFHLLSNSIQQNLDQMIDTS